MDRAAPAALQAVRASLWNLASLALALSVWQLVCLTVSPDFPTPLASFRVCVQLLGTAFTKIDGTPGIGFQVLASLRRIAIGFALSAAVAIPAGVLIGVSPTCRKLLDPIVQVLRPVSPLVWFPLALVAFKSMGGVSSSTLFTIFITSLWPTLINTAVGVKSLPGDYRIVAQVFRFSRGRYLRKILLPHSLPYILTGLRLSMGNAWLVIVAAEMLSGDVGIGFFAWDSYNAGGYERMIAAVAAIGGVGLALDRGFNALHRHFDYRGADQ
ncbi:MAG: nitrate ABC transporter permease [Gemmatimonadaceae bacterium]